MNDPIEKIHRDTIAFFEGECAKQIQWAQKQKRTRARNAVFWGGVFLLFAFWDFYQLKYWSGIFDSVEAIAFAAFNWKVFSMGVESARLLKKLAALHKLYIQEQLDQHLKERGF
jgi:hypothetical protein